MEYVTICGLHKKASKMVFGTATPLLFAAVAPGATSEDKEKAFALLDQVFAAGINTFDCAAHYGEQIMGEWMAARGNREECIIITKGAHPNAWRNRVTDYDILSDIHDSLVKLQTNYIDVYMLHRDNSKVGVESIVAVLNSLKQEGKIKVYGGSNWKHTRIAEANDYAKDKGLSPFSVSSPNFGLAEQVADPWVCDARFGDGCITISGPENKAARAFYAKTEIPVFAYSSLARGFFSGAFLSQEPEKAKEILDMPGYTGYFCENNLERLHRCEQLAKEKDVTVAQIAMAWIYNQPFTVLAISSPVTQKQLQENVEAISIKLSAAELKWLNLEE